MCIEMCWNILIPIIIRDFLQVPAVRELFTVSGMEPPEDGQIIHFIQAIKKTYDKTTVSTLITHWYGD